MDEVITDVKFNDTARMFARAADRYGVRRPALELLADAARRYEWGGLGMVRDDDLGVLPDWAGGFWEQCKCQCWNVHTRANAEAAHRMFRTAGVRSDDWNGWLVWDASQAAGHKVARDIARRLDVYAFLDEERHSEIEWDTMVETIADAVLLPDGVDAEHVLEAMDEPLFCCDCQPVTRLIDRALEDLGFRECPDRRCFRHIPAGATVCAFCGTQVS